MAIASASSRFKGKMATLLLLKHCM